MKGYFIDISGFNYKKQELALFAIHALSGGVGFTSRELSALSSFRWAGNVDKDGSKFTGVGGQYRNPTTEQEKHIISFNDLMDEYGFNYAENGVSGFRRKDIMEAEKEIDRLRKTVDSLTDKGDPEAVGDDLVSEAEKELKKTDQLIESLGVESGIISDLQSEIESLHGQLRSKSEEIGQLNVKLHETEKELSKSRISGAVIFTCLVVVAISNLFFGG